MLEISKLLKLTGCILFLSNIIMLRFPVIIICPMDRLKSIMLGIASCQIYITVQFTKGFLHQPWFNFWIKFSKKSLVCQWDLTLKPFSDLICTLIQPQKASNDHTPTLQKLIIEIKFFVGDSIFQFNRLRMHALTSGQR